MATHLLLIDGLNLIRRVHAAIPGSEAEKLEAALNSASHSLAGLIRRFSPSHAVCVFDGPELSWRHLVYPDYKAGRKPMPELLRQNLLRFHQAFREQGVESLLIPTLEADDVLATLASKTLALRDKGPKRPGRGVAVTLVSTDKGFCQLLDEGECFQIWNPFAKQRVDAASVREKYGMEVEQLCDYWALCGDSTNHISGAPGIGPKTARQLLNDYAGLEALYQHLDELPDRQQKQLREGRELAELALRLVRLHRNEALSCRLRDFRLPSV